MKVGIVGCGFVRCSAAYAIALGGVAKRDREGAWTRRLSARAFEARRHRFLFLIQRGDFLESRGIK